MVEKEYIDKELLIKAAKKYGIALPSIMMNSVPAADVRENIKSKWIEFPECLKYENAYSEDFIICPNCEAGFNVLDNDTERFNFCPNCGADMRGKNK